MNRGLLIEAVRETAAAFRKLHKAYKSGRKAGVTTDEAVYARALQIVERSKQALDEVMLPLGGNREEDIPF